MGSSTNLFKKYKDGCRVLVETGTWLGDGIQCAIDAGYKKVYSCDINQEKVKKARIRFSKSNVTVFKNPSKVALVKIFHEVKERCVIFLDGHSMPYNLQDSSKGFGLETIKVGCPPCPLLDELEVIKNHYIKDHIILIDDFQCFNTWVFGGITFNQVLEIIHQINCKYNYSIEGNVVCFKVGKFSEDNRISDYYLHLKTYYKNIRQKMKGFIK